MYTKSLQNVQELTGKEDTDHNQLFQTSSNRLQPQRSSINWDLDLTFVGLTFFLVFPTFFTSMIRSQRNSLNIRKFFFTQRVVNDWNVINSSLYSFYFVYLCIILLLLFFINCIFCINFCLERINVFIVDVPSVYSVKQRLDKHWQNMGCKKALFFKPITYSMNEWCFY